MLGHHRHASETLFKWQMTGGQTMARFKWYLDPLSPKIKTWTELDPLWQNFLDPRMNSYILQATK